jgi:hypothetical protein
MERLGILASEGGPILLMDAAHATAWHGTNSSDYERACDLLDGPPSKRWVEIPLGSWMALLWEIGGEGIADVFRLAPDRHVIVKSWTGPDEKDREAAVRELAAMPAESPIPVGSVDLASGVLLLLYAVEDGAAITNLQGAPPVQVKGSGLAFSNSGLTLAVSPGVLRCVQDEVKSTRGSALRLHITT